MPVEALLAYHTVVMSKHEDIIGLHYGHDATVALIRDGQLVEAMSEERLSRQKKHIGFPLLSWNYLKDKYQISDVSRVYVVGEEASEIINWDKERFQKERQSREQKPDWYLRGLFSRFDFLQSLLRLRRKIISLGNQSDSARAMVENKIKEVFGSGVEITYVNHHEAHLWAAVPFMENRQVSSLVISLDGEGDGLSGMVAVYEGGRLDIKHRFKNSESLGLLYSAVVDVLGMARNEHEFKVMGLAPYAKASAGEKAYERLKKVLWFDVEKMEFEAITDMRTVTDYLVAHNINTAFRFDSLAYGIQKLTETITQNLVREAVKRYGISRVAIGGGVFMNVKANQYLAEMPEVDELLITPSGGDESIAIGAAVKGYAVLHNHDLTKLYKIDALYLGSESSDEDIKSAIDNYPAVKKWKLRYFDSSIGESIEKEVAKLLAENSVVGRFKGRAEWGARALGNRSILANPTSRDNVKLINEMIKGRDFWMPFATSMLYERRHDYLYMGEGMEAPYMAITFNTKPLAHRELIAALHPYDLTSRPQLVREETNPAYHALIKEFENLTGIGGILNTSFNLHGEPNVEKPEDALRTFELSGLPHLAIGNYLLSKE